MIPATAERDRTGGGGDARGSNAGGSGVRGSDGRGSNASGSKARAAVPRTEIAIAAGLVLFVLACAVWLRLDPRRIFGAQTIDSLRAVVARLWPPRLNGEVLRKAGRGVVETLSISIVGTTLGAVIGLALAPFCSQTQLLVGTIFEGDRPGPAERGVASALHWGARLLANFLRTVPYFVWAILFWFMVGLGPFAGALAIAVHTGGVFARLYATAMDQVDPRPLEALRAVGAGRLQVLLFGTLPAARSALASYTLYRWEVNIRESAVLGLVGAGGLGFYISYAIGTFDWSSLATYLIAVIGLVLMADALSARLRRALL
jgi:phosphonate transport system permease protein